MKRLIGFGILVAIAVVVMGVHEAYVYFTNREPVRMSCADYLSQRPSAKWVELTDCVVDYPGAIQVTSRIIKADKGSFVPVRPPGARGRASILLKVDTDEAEALALDAMGKEMAGGAIPGKTISGLIGSWSDENSKTVRALETSKEVSPGFVILYEGRKPELGLAAVLPVIAVVGVGALFFVARKSRSAGPASAPPPLGAAPPPLPPAAGR